jgi:hypothetical protein
MMDVYRQQAGAATYGPGYHASGFVFTNLNGDPMAPDRLTRTFRWRAGDRVRATVSR